MLHFHIPWGTTFAYCPILTFPFFSLCITVSFSCFLQYPFSYLWNRNSVSILLKITPLKHCRLLRRIPLVDPYCTCAWLCMCVCLWLRGSCKWSGTVGLVDSQYARVSSWHPEVSYWADWRDPHCRFGYVFPIKGPSFQLSGEGKW